MMKTQVLILGAGPAGLMAGIYATRAGLKAVVLTGSAQGGQLLLTHQIENFPGFLKISGTELVENLTQQAVQSGVELIFIRLLERRKKAKCGKCFGQKTPFRGEI